MNQGRIKDIRSCMNQVIFNQIGKHQSILNKSQITLEDTNQESLNQFNKF